MKSMQPIILFFAGDSFYSPSAGFPIVRVPPPILRFFSPPPPPIKTDARHRVHPPFKNEAPNLKNKHPAPLKRETPFHEMIPRKSTINYNLKSS